MASELELYVFGFNGHAQFPDPVAPYPDYHLLKQPERPRKNIHVPTCVLRCPYIDVEWASWCDCVVSVLMSDPPGVPSTAKSFYYGSPLKPSQAAHALARLPGDDVQTFGGPLSWGLRCMRRSGVHSSAITFFPEKEEEPVNEEEDTETCSCYPDEGSYKVKHVVFESSGAITAALDAADPNDSSLQPLIARFESIDTFRAWLAVKAHPVPHELMLDVQTTPKLKQLLAASTILLALSEAGQVYSWTWDPRFPICLGRPCEDDCPAVKISPIAFLSETNVVKIACGGYISAAISDDGECFLWGKQSPSATGDLNVLTSAAQRPDPPPASPKKEELVLPVHPKDPQIKGKTPGRKTVFGARDMYADEHLPDQDEYIKRLSIKCGGEETRITDAAVGNGHILVAAEAETEGKIVRGVFSAGQGDYGQLGVGEERPKFQASFKEVVAMQGKKVKGVTAAGWSSWIVVENDESQPVE